MTNRSFITDGDGPMALLLAHGAGAPMDSPFMTMLARQIACYGIRVIRFEFNYMARRRNDGRRQPPPKAEKLVDEFRHKLEHQGQSGSVFVGGKSLGGRVASLLAAEPGDCAVSPAGCLCFGYPFHPPGKPDRWRTAHFDKITTPVRIFQGTRDPFGRFEEVGEITQRLASLTSGVTSFSDSMPLQWLTDGDHDYHPRKRSGRTQQDLINEAAKSSVDWMRNNA